MSHYLGTVCLQVTGVVEQDKYDDSDDMDPIGTEKVGVFFEAIIPTSWWDDGSFVNRISKEFGLLTSEKMNFMNLETGEQSSFDLRVN